MVPPALTQAFVFWSTIDFADDRSVAGQPLGRKPELISRVADVRASAAHRDDASGGLREAAGLPRKYTVRCRPRRSSNPGSSPGPLGLTEKGA